jgi:outer membrane protein TolC
MAKPPPMFAAAGEPQLPPPRVDTTAPAEAPLFKSDEVFQAGTEVLRIDLVTALRLANASNPTIAVARQRVEAAYANLDQAQVFWLPDLDGGPAYLRHDGEVQNALGKVFPTNKQALAVGATAALTVKTSDALFAPLISRRLVEAQTAASEGVNNAIQLDVALAYLDLLQWYAALAVNADLLARDRIVEYRARNAGELARTGADLNRASTELQLRLQERIQLKAQVRVASSRLASLLLLQPGVGLLPADPVLVPVTLIPEDASIDDLVSRAIAERPELAESRALVEASEARLRQSRLEPLIPHVQVSYFGGGFGGGQNTDFNGLKGRGDAAASALWEVRNLGFGNLADNRLRRAQVGEANYRVLEVQARVGDEVVRAVQLARARREALEAAQAAVREALEMYRKLDEVGFVLPGPKKTLDVLEPLLAIQALAQARLQYLSTVIDYNRAQFQLYTAVGRPSLEGIPQATPVRVDVPPAPPPYKPPAEKKP